MADKHWRSLAKALSWRATGTIDTIVLSYFITGKLKFAFSIGAAELLTKTLLFYLHERLWNKVKFGRAKEPEYHI